ncbi:hypothetical protein D3C71_85250 [compost metagenome]
MLRYSLWIALSSGVLSAQASAPVQQDAATAWSAGLPDQKHTIWKDTPVSPKRAGLYSMLLPGLGQISNKQYWKLPVVYGLLGTGIYFFQYNLSGYNEFRKVYADRLQNIYTDKYIHSIPDMATIKGRRDYHKRDLDLTVLLSVVGYGFQIIDAHVAAHLRGFDITPGLSCQFRPSVQYGLYGMIPCISIAFKPL